MDLTPTSGPIDIGIAVVGTNGLAAYPIVVALRVERSLDVAHCSAGSHEEMVGPD